MKLSILLHGIESDRALLDVIKDKLQIQLNLLNRDDLEALFYIDNGETTVEEKKQWLLEQCTGRRYVFVDSSTDIQDNFLLLRYNAIKLGWPTEKQLTLNIFHK